MCPRRSGKHSPVRTSVLNSPPRPVTELMIEPPGPHGRLGRRQVYCPPSCVSQPTTCVGFFTPGMRTLRQAGQQESRRWIGVGAVDHACAVKATGSKN